MYLFLIKHHLKYHKRISFAFFTFVVLFIVIILFQSILASLPSYYSYYDYFHHNTVDFETVGGYQFDSKSNILSNLTNEQLNFQTKSDVKYTSFFFKSSFTNTHLTIQNGDQIKNVTNSNVILGGLDNISLENLYLMQLINIEHFENKILINSNFLTKNNISNVNNLKLTFNNSKTIQNFQIFTFLNFSQLPIYNQPQSDILLPVNQFLDYITPSTGTLFIIGQQNRNLFSIENNGKNIEIELGADYSPFFLHFSTFSTSSNKVADFFYSYGSIQTSNFSALLVITIPIFILVIYFGNLIISKLNKEFYKSWYLLKPRGLDESTIKKSFFLYSLIICIICSIVISLIFLFLKELFILIVFDLNSMYFDISQLLVLIIFSLILSTVLSFYSLWIGINNFTNKNVKDVQKEKYGFSKGSSMYLLVLSVSLIGFFLPIFVNNDIIFGSTKMIAVSFYYSLISSIIYIIVPFGLIISIAYLFFDFNEKISLLINRKYKRIRNISPFSSINRRLGINFILLFSLQFFLILFVSQLPNITYVSYLNQHGTLFETYYSNQNDLNGTETIQNWVLQKSDLINDSFIVAKAQNVFFENHTGLPIELYELNISQIPLRYTDFSTLKILKDAEKNAKGVLLDFSPNIKQSMTITINTSSSLTINLEQEKIHLPGFYQLITNEIPQGYPLLQGNITSYGLILPDTINLNNLSLAFNYKIKFFANENIQSDTWLSEYNKIDALISNYYNTHYNDPYYANTLQLYYIGLSDSVSIFQMVLPFEISGILLFTLFIIIIYFFIELKDNQLSIGILLSKGYSRTNLRYKLLIENLFTIIFTIIVSLLLSYILSLWISQFSSFNSQLIIPIIPTSIYSLLFENILLFTVALFVIIRYTVNNKPISKYLEKFD